MIRTLVLIICVIGLPIELQAMSEEDSTVVDNYKVSTDSTIVHNDDATKTLIKELADKREEIERLRQNLESLQSQCVKKEITLNNIIDSLKTVAENHASNAANWRGKHDKVLGEMKELRESVSRIDSIVFKQCLLYPQERRYNEVLIKESLHSLEVLDISTNPEYEDYCRVYIEMLNNYGKYNQELIDFLQKERLSFSMKQWSINSGVALATKNKLKTWDYYRLFENRNIKPYKSIPYLDNIVEQFLRLLDEPKSISQKKYEELLEMLKPSAR